MKRTFLILLAAALALSACKQEIRTEKLSLEEEIPFSEGSQFHLDLRADVEFPTAGLNAKAIDNMRKAIREHCFGENYGEVTVPLAELGKQWRDDQVDNYLTTNRELLKEMGIGEAEAFNLNWAADVEGAFGEDYRNWINYHAERYDYAGGAHGINCETPLVFDKKTGLPVSSDVFTAKVHPTLLAALLDEYKFDKLDLPEGVDRDNVFYVETIEPSPFFSVGEDGITFYYQPYDIAPYVFGVIPITIPWEEL